MTTNEPYDTEYDTAAQETQKTNDCYVDLEGVSAEKVVTLSENDILHVEFEIHSERSDPVRVKIRDPLPHGFPLDRVGFHPDYGRKNWSLGEGHEVVYESTLEPGAELHTIYAVKSDGETDPLSFSMATDISAEEDGEAADATTDPTPDTDVTAAVETESDRDGGGSLEETVDGEVETFDIPDQNGSERERSPAEEQSADGGEAQPSGEDPSTDETIDSAKSPTERDGPEATVDADAHDDSPTPPGEGEDCDPVAGQELINRLTMALEDGNATDEELAALGDQLSRLVGGPRRGQNSLEARLRRAERELDELSAYTDALSEFLDERGTGRDVIDDLEEQAADVHSHLETVSDDVSDLAARLDEVTARLDAVDERSETLDGELSELRTRHEETAERLDRTQQSVESLDQWLEAAEMDRIERRETLYEELESVAEDVDEIRRLHRGFGRLLDDFTSVGRETTAEADDGGNGETLAAIPDSSEGGKAAERGD